MLKDCAFTLRFAVGKETERRSGIWRVWRDAGKSDVYLAIRTIAGINKISLHPSGSCTASLTSQEVARNPAAHQRLGNTRHFDQWQRPICSGELLSIPLRLRYPESELRLGIDRAPKGVVVQWLEAPSKDQVLDIVCIFTSSRFLDGDYPWKAELGTWIAQSQLPNGETFWLIARLYAAPVNLTAILDSRKPKDLPAESRALMGETGPGNVRILTDAASNASLAAA